MVKTLGTEILKEATVDLLLKTLGARAFLAGNDFSDSVHDLLTPAIYEGENELLSLGLVASLGRAHRGQVLEPIAAATRAAGFERPDLASVRQLWAARRPLAFVPHLGRAAAGASARPSGPGHGPRRRRRPRRARRPGAARRRARAHAG